MARQRPRQRSVFAANLRRLMEACEDSQHSLGLRAGVAQKTVSNVVTEKAAPTIETAEALSRAYGLEAWVLLLADLTVDQLRSSAIERLVAACFAAPEETQRYVLSVAERDAKR